MPTYAFLRCYHCHSKVLYASGISDLIKCTKCTTVNEIPKMVKEYEEIVVEEPVYHVYHDREEDTLKGGVNPYEGTNKEWDLEDLLSQEELATLNYPEL